MESNESQGGFLASLALFFAWFLAAVLSVVDIIAIRGAIRSLLAIVQVANQEAYHARGGVGADIFTNFGISAVDNVFLLIMGCAAIGLTVWSEYYFRKGKEKGLLYKRIAKMLGIEVGIIILSIIIVEIAGFILSRMAL